jgi:hypothetical protein
MTIYIDRFSAGLDDLTRKQQADPVAVLRVLKATGRFSVFEATDNDIIARTMTRLVHKGYQGYGRLIEIDNSCGYPWTKVKLTEAGERLLADATNTARTGRCAKS